MSEIKYNEQQQAAITSTATKVAIVAGPGSGKTQTIAGKVLSMPPEERSKLAVLTFTNAAAAELRERVGDQSVGFIGTLHGWCYNFLKRNGHLIGLPSNFSVVNQFDADSVLDQVLAESRGNLTKSEVAATIQWPWMIHGHLDSTSQVEVAAAAFMSKLWAQGRVDYNGLLQLTLDILQKNKSAVSVPEYLIVDEAQDSSEIDWMIYDQIWSKQCVVVGDPDQSIYGFRGAVPQLFNRWCLVADSLIKLEISYRCDQSIAGVANRLMSKAVGRDVQKEIIPISDKKGFARFSSMASDTAAAHFVKGWCRERDPDESWAILCRTNAEVASIRAMLIASGYELDPERDSGAVSKLVTYLDAIANPRSEVAFRAMFRTFKQDIQPGHRERVLLQAKISDAPLERSMFQFFPEAEAFEEIRKHPLNLEAWSPVMKQGRFRDISLIPVLIKEAAHGSSIQELALAAAQRMEQGQFAQRTVRTIHRAKGLEWDCVLIPSINEGNLPGPGVDQEEEHRRLLFVAITRARHKVTGLYDFQNPSRFLVSIGLI